VGYDAVKCDVPSQNTVLLIVTAARTSHVTPTYSISNETTVVIDILKFLFSSVLTFSAYLLVRVVFTSENSVVIA
jgi:hypothetical protein